MKFLGVLMTIFLSAAAVQAQQAIAPNPQALPSYITGPNWWPTVLKPYQPSSIRPLVMENSPRLHELIRNGKLRLSMADALALALENNLDIAVQRFWHPIAEVDVLRASSGQAARGFQGALVPGGLTQGALGVGVNQPLYNGRGAVPNQRFIMVAKNNMRTSDELLRQQVTATIVQVENAYWNLAAASEDIFAAERNLEVAQRLDDDTKARLEIGTVARIELATTASAVAAAQRDLIIAKTEFQLEETQLKRLLSKKIDSELNAAGIETTDELPEPNPR